MDNLRKKVILEKLAESDEAKLKRLDAAADKIPEYKKGKVNLISVPVRDPISGRRLSSGERWHEQSLPPKRRGPVHKDMVEIKHTAKAYWKGAPAPGDYSKWLKKQRTGGKSGG